MTNSEITTKSSFNTLQAGYIDSVHAYGGNAARCDTVLGCIMMRRRYVLTALEDIKSVASGVINEVSRLAPLNDERRYNITLILNELLVNSFEHARPSSRTPVLVHADYTDGFLHIGVTDGGAGFEYTRQHTEADETDALFSERGRGLKLVRALCSEVFYNESGNSVEVSIAI